jgi:hypothetical protein
MPHGAKTTRRVMQRSRKLKLQGYPTTQAGQAFLSDDSQADKHKAIVSQTRTQTKNYRTQNQDKDNKIMRGGCR